MYRSDGVDGRRVRLMKSLFVGLVLTLGAVFLPQSPQAAAEQACGLPDVKPLWIDYTDGTVPFSQELFGKPGIVAATGRRRRGRRRTRSTGPTSSTSFVSSPVAAPTFSC